MAFEEKHQIGRNHAQPDERHDVREREDSVGDLFLLSHGPSLSNRVEHIRHVGKRLLIVSGFDGAHGLRRPYSPYRHGAVEKSWETARKTRETAKGGERIRHSPPFARRLMPARKREKRFGRKTPGRPLCRRSAYPFSAARSCAASRAAFAASAALTRSALAASLAAAAAFSFSEGSGLCSTSTLFLAAGLG